MNDIIAEFGYNTDLDHEGYLAWENMGTKYNFNIDGNVLGIFTNGSTQILISQVTRSFGDDCMAGTIDAREVVLESDEPVSTILVSNNELSEKCMTISRLLSNKETREELNAGKSIDQTKGFASLAKLGIDLKRLNVNLGERVTVCGVEPEKFESFKTPTVSKSK